MQALRTAKRVCVASSSSSSMEKVEFGSGVPAYICGDKSSPGVLMLQEWWGITEEIKDQANFLASNGFRVMIPDLYKGKLGLGKNGEREEGYTASIGIVTGTISRSVCQIQMLKKQLIS